MVFRDQLTVHVVKGKIKGVQAHRLPTLLHRDNIYFA